MFLRALLVCTVVLLSIPAFGQSAPGKPAFEIADVRVSDRRINVGVTGNARNAGSRPNGQPPSNSASSGLNSDGYRAARVSIFTLRPSPEATN